MITIKRIVICSILAGFMFAAALAESGDYVPFWWWGENFTGVVTQMGKDWIKIKDLTGVEKTFEIDAFTKLIVSKSPKITEGLWVKVTYKARGERNIAKAIREIKPPPDNVMPTSPPPETP